MPLPDGSMATVIEQSTLRESRTALLRLVNDQRNRAVFYQILVFGLVAWGAWYLFANTTANLEARGMAAGFNFLETTSGFSIAWSIIPFDPTRSYGYVYLVGILNTLLVSVIAIIFTTMLGFLIGILRLSRNWLVKTLAAWYVEIVRNTPLLLQILFWFLGVFGLLPRPQQSIGFGMLELNNRGFYFPQPLPQSGFWITGLAIVVAVGASYWLTMWAKKRFLLSGERFPVLWTVLSMLVGFPALVFVATGMPLIWEHPTLQGFNFVGGGNVPPAFCALLIALVVYHASHIAESVRAGILAVGRGQTEAAYSLGIKSSWTMRLIVIPQAMRASVPLLISIWGAVVKNSSLAIAIGYPDLVSVYMQTSLNQSGHAIEIVAMVMLFYSSVSLIISGALNYYNKLVQLQER